MSAQWRWWLVGLGTAMLVATPAVAQRLPVSDPDVSAPVLLDMIRGSSDVGYTGYATSTGTLRLPEAGSLADVATLLGERTTMRAWWRSPTSWRVATLRTSGETDVFRDGSGTTIWDFEKGGAKRSPDVAIRLPRSDDLLPPRLAALAMSGAADSEVDRLPARRVAGRAAPGLRLVPGTSTSTVARVEVWADADTGLPLRTDVYARGDDVPALSASFDSVSVGPPETDEVAFAPAPAVEVEYDRVIDVADAADRFSETAPPESLAGLERDTSIDSVAVGVYGDGVDRLIAIPLWDRVADPIREQLSTTPRTVDGPRGQRLSAGLVNLLLTPNDPSGDSWLLLGTVRPAALERAGAQVTRSPER